MYCTFVRGDCMSELISKMREGILQKFDSGLAESGMDSMLMEVNWLDVLLMVVVMLQLGVVSFDDLAMVDDVVKLGLDNLLMSEHTSVLFT